MSLVNESATARVGVRDRRAAVDEAVASLRVDGLEPCDLGHAVLHSVAEGEIGFDEAVTRIVAPYRR